MSAPTEIPHVEPSHRGSAGWHVWGGQVRLICGGCGKDAGHLENHTVEADGTVHASLLCPMCGWHVWGKLTGWTHGRKLPGAEVKP